jgi:1-acyl-sn-glycerol-3-phosphate acyltransferase
LVNLRFLLAFPLVVAWMFGVGIPGLLIGVWDPRRRLILAITRGWARLILLCAGIRVVVEGRENVPAGPAVFATNHVSALDIPILCAALPADFRIVHKQSLYWAPVIGAYLYFAHHVPVDRKNPFRAKRSLKRAAARIHDGTSVALFPEGTRSRDGRLQVFKRGSFVLAQDAGVPVVPVSMIGVKALVPGGLVSVRGGRVTLRIHPAVATEGRAPEAVADEVRGIIQRDVEDPAA